MNHSKIEWTQATWNPVTGCTRVSPGCAHCYAATMARRLKGRFGYPSDDPFALTLHPGRVEQPLHWKKPRLVFVNSMSDLFHEQVPLEFVQQCFAVMASAHWHQFQVLTKRSERLAQLAKSIPWPNNVWQGVSVESAKYKHRVDDLKQVPAALRFLSIEPLLAPIGVLDLSGIHWVIVGGESGPDARPMDLNWVLEVRDQCLAQKVPFFLKQLGGHPKKRGGAEAVLDGKLWREMPMALPALPV